MTNRQGRLDEAERTYILNFDGISASGILAENAVLLFTTSLSFTSLAFVAQVLLTTGDAFQVLLTCRSPRNGLLGWPRFRVIQFREVAQGPAVSLFVFAAAI